MIPHTKGGWSKDGRKVKGTSHWISAAHAVPAEFRLYDRLFTKPNPDEGEGFLSNLNPQSLEKISGFIESGWRERPAGSHYQFETTGILLRGSRLASRHNGFQPQRFAKGFLVQNRRETAAVN